MGNEVGEHQIKKGADFYWYYWTIPAFFIFLVINSVFGMIKVVNMNMSLMISVVSFLFGFLLSITFSMIIARYNSLKNDLAEETSKLVVMYNFSKHLGDKFHETIKDLIDEYTRVTLRDYVHYSVGRPIFTKVMDSLDLIEAKTSFQKNCASSFFSELRSWAEVRERLEVLTEKRAELSLNVAIYVLGGFLSALLFLNRGDSFTDTIFVILSTIIVFIFLIIEDYDHLHIGDYVINISNSEELFDLIGADRYYPNEVLGKIVLEKGRMYRIGIKDRTGKETIYSIRYTPVFNTKLKVFVDKIKGEKFFK